MEVIPGRWWGLSARRLDSCTSRPLVPWARGLDVLVAHGQRDLWLLSLGVVLFFVFGFCFPGTWD